MSAIGRHHMSGWHALSAVGVYLLTTVYCTWPLARLSEDHIFPRGSPDDILLVLWVLSWDVHALRTDPARLFDGNILHPAPDILAHSEHLLGTLPFFAPAFLITGNPVLGLNVVMLASFVLGGLFMHALVWTWTGSALAAYTAGLSFAFAPWRVNGLNWPHLLSTQYLPLVLLGLEHAATTRRPRAVLLLAAALSLQVLTSYYLAHMAAIVVGAFVVSNLLARGGLNTRASWIALGAGLALPAACLLSVSLPYLERYRAGLLQRSPNDQTLDLLANLGAPWSIMQSFVGWGPAVLAVFALGPALFRRAEGTLRVRMWTLIVILACALAVSPGPRGLFGGAISMYSWLETIVPGFSLVRVPFRFGILASFAVSSMAGLGAWQLVRLIRGRPRSLRYATATLILCCALYGGWRTRVPSPVRLPTRADLPPAYLWLAAHGEGGPLLELPMHERPALSGWRWDRPGARAMYFSIYHWLPLLNGYTGYMPPSAAAVDDMARRLPDDGAVQNMVDCTNVRWVLVRRLGPPQASAWQQTRAVRLVSVFPAAGQEDRLYEVVLRPKARCADSRFAGND